MNTKPISKAKQARIDEENRLKQAKIDTDNLFVSTYTEKLFKLAHEFQTHVQTNKWNSVTISQEGFTFDLDTYLGSDLFLPHTPINDLRDIKNRFEMIQDKIDEILESKRKEEEKQVKIKNAKDKINNILSKEELDLLGL